MNMLYDNDELKNHYNYKLGTVNGKEVLFIELHLNNGQEMDILKTRSGLIQDNEYLKFVKWRQQCQDILYKKQVIVKILIKLPKIMKKF